MNRESPPRPSAVPRDERTELRDLITEAARAGDSAAPSRRGGRSWPLVFIAATLVICAVLLLWHRPSVRTLPPEVLGTWTTVAPDYASRALILATTSIAIRTGGGDDSVAVYPILQVQRSTTPGGVLFQVDYAGGPANGGTSTLSFIFRTAGSPELLLAHQPQIVWTRAAPH